MVVVMPRRRKREKPEILATVDTFIGAVPWGERRKVLVFYREHGGRSYVRLRTWNRHRTRGLWYPTKRFFVIPVEHVEALAETLRAAARGTPIEKKPRWYEARERADQKRYQVCVELEAPQIFVARARRKVMKLR